MTNYFHAGIIRHLLVIYNHGKAVTLDVSPVWPAQPTCGDWQMQINRGIGAEPAGAFDNAKHAVRHSFAVLFTHHGIQPQISQITQISQINISQPKN